MVNSNLKIGVLALQGSFAEHKEKLEGCMGEKCHLDRPRLGGGVERSLRSCRALFGDLSTRPSGLLGMTEGDPGLLGMTVCRVIEVRKKEDLKNLSGLIIPGGESTAISKLWGDLYDPLKKMIKKGFPVYGTCAGAVLLAKKVSGKVVPESLGVFDMDIERNAYGSQMDSFEEEIDLSKVVVGAHCNAPLQRGCAIFIRAPKIKKIGKNVEILAKRKNGEIIMAREGNILVSTFHPELTDSDIVHRYFISICKKCFEF